MNDHEDEMRMLGEHLATLANAGQLDLDLESLERTSRRRILASLRSRTTRSAQGRRGRLRRVLIAAASISAIGLAMIAVAPDGNDASRDGGPRLGAITASASAAEALDQAGDAIVRETEPESSGPVWHGVARSYVDGELTSITEQWFDPTAGTYLAAAWGDQVTEHRELLQVVGVDAADTSRLRTYAADPGSDDWEIPDESPSPHLVQELPAGYGAGQRRLVTAVHAWLDVFESDPTDAELIDATLAFGASIADDYFGGAAPEFSRETMSQVGAGVVLPEVQSDMDREWKAGKDAIRIRPMLYLLSTVQSTPEATRALYEQIGRFDTLERLGNDTIDGRPVVRIRYDEKDLGSHRERVLVIDATSGVPLRTESVDGNSWTEIRPARRVKSLGDDSLLCDADIVPCELLHGEGPVAAKWNDYLDSEAGARATEFMKDPTNAFSLAVPLRKDDPADGIYGVFTGECSRDARMMSVCRG